MEDEQDRKDACAELVAFLQQFASRHPGSSKDAVAKAAAQHFKLKCDRSVYFCDHFAVRFSASSKSSFPGTVLGLSRLCKYDHLPFVVCVVRPTGAQLLMANSTFIDKISHSSQSLSHDKIRGSFNGTNIIRNFDGLDNTVENFEALFELHREIGFEENYSRIVENTLAIRARGARFSPTTAEHSTILSAATLAASLSHDSDYIALGERLASTVEQNRDAILSAATSDSGNLRGNAIEQIITSAGNLHRTEDIAERLPTGIIVYIDVKTKLIGRSSNPAAYNIDKFLRLLAEGNGVFSFFFVGMDVQARTISTRFVSCLDTTILLATRVQPHWAGRNSRGGTQLSGDLSPIFAPDYRENVVEDTGRAFLQDLLVM